MNIYGFDLDTIDTIDFNEHGSTCVLYVVVVLYIIFELMGNYLELILNISE